MKRFNFKNDVLKLDLCGKKFNLRTGDRLYIRCGAVRREAAKRLEALYADNPPAENILGEVCDFLRSSVDLILGDGAAEKIFGKREMTVTALTDLLSYILDEIAENMDRALGESR